MTDQDEQLNAADPKQVRDRGRKEKRAEDLQLEDLRKLLALPEGRRFLRRYIFDECAFLQTSYHASGQQFACNEGRRGVAVQLVGELMAADLEGYLALIREQQVKP